MSKKTFFLMAFVVVLSMFSAPAFATDYYIDPVSGSDSSGDGSLGSPWKTFANCMYYYSYLDRPSGWVRLQPGETIYLMNGTHNTYIDPGGGYPTTIASFRSYWGSSDSWFHIKAYPGHSPVLDGGGANPGIRIWQCDYWEIEGLEIKNCYDRGVLFQEGIGFKMSNTHIYDTDGVDNNNVAGLELGGGTTDAEVYDCVFNDNYDRTAADTGGQATHNCNNAVLFSCAGDIIFHDCDFYQTLPITDSKSGGGLKYKHASANPTSTFQVYNCTFDNHKFFHFGTGTANTHFHHNLITGGAVSIDDRDWGGRTHQTDQIFEYNTIYGTYGFFLDPTDKNVDQDFPDDPTGIVYRNNIVYDTASSYGLYNGTIVIDNWLTDSLYSETVAALSFSDNCYYNPNRACKFNLAADGRASGGGEFSLSEWQAEYGYDTDSVEADPLFVDAPGGDFHLQGGSPAQGMGMYAGIGPQPPGQASNPSPADSATDVIVDADLSWSAGSGSTSSDVYFGTDSTPDSGEFQGNQTATTFEPGTMANDTTYYWRIDEINAQGTTSGTVWSFTTGSGLDAGLIGWWKLDDGGGSTAVDSGSAGNDGSVNGPLWVTGKLNGGLDFDGLDDYVEIPNESDYDITTSITVAVWLKLDPGDTTTNFMSFVTKGRESAWSLQRNARTSNVSFFLNGLTSWDGLKGSANVFDGEWHHVAGVYNGSRISLYVDATEDTFIDITGSIGTNDWGVFIGANAEDVNSSSGYRHCNGIVDDVRIYDHALNENEIAVLAGFDPAYARNPNPRDGAKSIDPDQDLSWTAGSDSTSSDVYFGTNFNDVETATTSDSEYMGNQTATTYDPGTLAINTYYYWRIDAIDTSNPSSPWTGDVWTFKTSSGQSDECTNWETLHPEWIFCDDFEDETSMVREGRYFAYESDEGDFVITDEAGFNNSKGMRVIFQQGEVTAGGMKLGFGRTPSSFDQGIRNTEDFREIYYRMYLKMENGWTGNPAKLSRATIFHSNDWSQAMIAHLWQGTGYALGIDPVRCVNASSQVVCIGYNDFDNMTWLGAQSGFTPVFRTDHSDTWYCVEAHVKLNDPGSSNGLQEFWIDGQLETSKTGMNFVESYTDYAINILLFENYWNTGSVQLQERYFDNIVVSTQAIGEFGAGPQLPGQASNPSPGNGTSDISINSDLSWTAGSGTTSHDVYFGTSSPGSFQGNQTATTFDTGTMSNNTTYYWRIDEINAEGTTTGVVWNFTTEAAPQPPGQATNPSPADSATNVSITADLSWTAGTGSTSSDVYFGTTSPGTFQGNQTATTYDPGTMANSTTYYWRIDEINAEGTTTGNVWSFTTEAAPQPPGQASNPSPANSATDVSITADLSWSAGSGSTSSDVYFGTDSTPDAGEFQGNQTATTYEPGTMANSTTYYWRIDEINAVGTTTGAVWSFTTVAAGAGTGLTGDYYDNMDFTGFVLSRVDATVNFNWGSGSPDPSIGADTFSVRWIGQVEPLYSETYTFYTTSDDGVRLWVDSQLVVDSWIDQGPTEHSGTIALTGDVKYDIQMDYYENGGGAVAELRWSSASQAKEIIPQSQLYESAGPQPPGQAGNPSPADSATDVSVDADLSWNAGSGATSRDVYFGTSSPGTFQGNQTATTFDCGSMSNDTTYYWRIDEINAAGTTTGNVWSFTTEAAATGDVEIIGSWTSGTSHAEEAGSNRALIFIAHAESSTDTSDLGSVTYGGQSMTKVVERNMHYSYSAYTCAFILDEAGIDAATSSTFVVTWNTAPSATPAYTSVFLQNVNQTTLTGATGTGGTTTTTAETPALSTSDGDMAIVAGTCGNDATYSTINGFTEAIEVVPSSADGIGGYLSATGSNVTPGVSHTNVNRQSVIGFVVQAGAAGPTLPGQASTPSPANSATDVSTTATLSWSAGTDATSHDVYFGTSSPGAFQGNQTAVTFDPGTLSYDTTYYWRIDEVNAAGTTTGNVWNFTTEAAPSPPGQASNPSPANSATDVSITADLSWTAGTGSTSSDVYFGTTSPGTFQGNQTATTFDPGTMANDTTYYWRIDEINVGGTTTGNVWSFTTIASAGDEIIGWWELNDASGTTAVDSSTYGNDGTLVGSLAWTDDAERGWCLDFTDANNYVTLPNESFFDITSNVSVMGWMKASYVDWRNFSTIIAKGKDPTGWALQKAGKTNAMSFYVAASGMPWDGIKAGTNVFDGQWHHIAGVYDGSTAYIYVDGGLDSNSVGCSGSITTNDWDVYIGENSQTLDEGTNAREWEGLIDDVRIYNYALTQSEVNDIYTGGAPTPPGQASNPTPTQSATNISIDADLSWNAGTGSTSSDVYFGTDSTPDLGEFKGNQTATTYEPGTMANDTTYYWRIDEVNAGGTTTGTVWSFTTIVGAPGSASNPSPASGAANVNINANLSWSAGSGATSHDVYFGTSSPGAFQGNQTAVTFDPGTMANDTTYYWRIDEVNAAGTTTGTVWNFTTIIAAPGQASSPSPANTATDVDINANLSWSAGSGATSHDVYFGTSSPGSYQGNQTSATFDPGTMANDTTYYWRIDEVNAGGTTTGSVWSFTTEAAAVPPPGQASNPSPANSAANVAVNTDLSWTAGSDTTSHDVYFGTSSPGSFQGNQAATTFDTGTMANDTTYYWRIDEVGLGGTTTGNVWNFTTIVAAPSQASNPSPGNGATDVSINADLSWSAGSGATSHDVYFGTSSPGTFQGNQTATTFDTGTMANDTTYYWRIDEINAAGTTTGSVWSFTTIVTAPAQASSPSPANSATDVSVSADLSWTAGSGATSHDVYFGTTSPGTFQGNQTATTFDTGTMANDTTYYWRIDELNAAGTTTGSVWNFTTIVSTGDEIIGWWELNDASGSTAADSSAYTNDGTLVGPPVWTNDAEQGWCLDFTGAGNYVTIPNESFFDLTDSITVTAWMKASYVDWRNFSTIIAKGRDGSGGWALQKASRANAMSFFVEVTGAPWDGIKAGVGTFDGQWHHVAGVYDGSASYIYIDGGLDSNSVSCSGSIPTNDWPVYIGENSKVLLDEASSAREWEGHIDDVRVYNYALSQSQINDIYTGGAPTLPGQASSPSPADSATDVSIDADLSWTAGSDTTSHDVYFGTDSTPDSGEFKGNQTATTYNPGTMANDTTYYWRIDEVNAEGSTTGIVWSFTTVAAPAGDVEIIGSWLSGTSHTEESGANRLLVFTAHVEDNDTDMNLTSVTYGGQSMTKVVEQNVASGYRAYVVAYVLDEAGINAASGSSFVVTWAQTPSRAPGFSSVFLQNVNQTAPTAATDGNGTTSSSTVATSALSTNDGDMVFVAGACGNSGTYTVNNGFTKGIELSISSADGVAGYKAATGAAETPSITHSNVNRQVVIGFVVQAQ